MRVPFEDEDLGMVQEAIEGGTGQEWVEEERRPFVQRAVRRDDERAALVALADDLVEVHGLLALERAEAQVVDDQQVGSREAGEAAVVGGVGAGGAELSESTSRRSRRAIPSSSRARRARRA